MLKCAKFRLRRGLCPTLGQLVKLHTPVPIFCYAGATPPLQPSTACICVRPHIHVFSLTVIIIIIIITKEYNYGGVMSEDCKDTLQTK